VHVQPSILDRKAESVNLPSCPARKAPKRSARLPLQLFSTDKQPLSRLPKRVYSPSSSSKSCILSVPRTRVAYRSLECTSCSLLLTLFPLRLRLAEAKHPEQSIRCCAVLTAPVCIGSGILTGLPRWSAAPDAAHAPTPPMVWRSFSRCSSASHPVFPFGGVATVHLQPLHSNIEKKQSPEPFVAAPRCTRELSDSAASTTQWLIAAKLADFGYALFSAVRSVVPSQWRFLELEDPATVSLKILRLQFPRFCHELCVSSPQKPPIRLSRTTAHLWLERKHSVAVM
jgi:hypothetical protein